ncbi:MAG TPA: hypothetical protein PLL57_07950 [Flavobacteriales bacterium]|nr:hypothetical protein [Flavobacteriales bacterium]
MLRTLTLTILWSSIPLCAQVDTVLLTELGRYQHTYSIGTISNSSYSCRIDRMGRDYLYMACWNLGLVTLDISDPAQPIAVDTLTRAELGGTNAMNLEQRGAVLYLALGGFNDDQQGTAFATVDISDPTAPVLLDRWDGGSAFTTGAAIVILQDDRAFLGAMEDGVVAFDIADPANITYLGSFLPDTEWPGLVAYPPNARGMAAQDDLLLLCYDAGALRAIDISDPANMSEVGRYLNPQQPALTPCAYNNVVIKGDRAIIATDFCGFEVVDISDPAAMTQVNWTNPWNCLGASWFGSDGHTNETVLALNDSLLFLSGGDSEMLIYDVSVPDDPTLAGGHILPNDTAAAWGVDVFGDRTAVCLLNNSFIVFPPQPYYSRFGGMVLYTWEVERTTGLLAASGLHRRPRLWPNPTTDQLSFTLDADPGALVRMAIMDAQGRRIMEQMVVLGRNGGATLDIAALKPGVHALRLENGSWTGLSTFIKE